MSSEDTTPVPVADPAPVAAPVATAASESTWQKPLLIAAATLVVAGIGFAVGQATTDSPEHAPFGMPGGRDAGPMGMERGEGGGFGHMRGGDAMEPGRGRGGAGEKGAVRATVTNVDGDTVTVTMPGPFERSLELDAGDATILETSAASVSDISADAEVLLQLSRGEDGPAVDTILLVPQSAAGSDGE